jgi:hypothetical protein
MPQGKLQQALINGAHNDLVEGTWVPTRRESA